MPQTVSAKRALRVDLKRRSINKLIQEKYKKAVKKAQEKPSLETISQAFSFLDRAVKNAVIHKNKAARVKSRLSKSMGKNSPAPTTKKSAKAKKAAPKKTKTKKR